MTHDEILEKSIWKAHLKSGYLLPFHTVNSDIKEGYPPADGPFHQGIKWGGDCFEIIFSHDFAKAFWGDKYPDDEEINDLSTVSGWSWQYTGLRWQKHLQEMVLWEDPILYLSKFI